MRQLNIETVKISDISPDPKNARKHDTRNIEEIKRSFEAHEQYAPLIVQRSSGKILVGNGRFEAMKQLGWQEAQVCFIDCTDVEAAKIALTDNRTSELATWDSDILKDVLAQLGPEPDIAGWSNEELEELFATQIYEPIDDENIGNASTLQNKLTFGKYVLYLTDEEFSKLEARMQEYIDENGTTFGFVESLL